MTNNLRTIKRHLLYAFSAALFGVVCAAFLVYVAGLLPGYLLHAATAQTSYGTDSHQIATKPLSPAQEQARENLDEDKLSTPVPSVYSRPHTVTASQYLVIDLTEPDSPAATTSIMSPFVLAERTILQKDVGRAVPIASLTKLVTAVVAQNILDQNTSIEITQKIINTEGDSADFRVGEKFNVPELMYPLLMVSSNDAGEALARSDPDGRADFIRTMNEWVQSIGAYHTYFADPTGLSPDNVSNAGDLAIIMRWVYQNRPGLIAITETKVKLFRVHTWTNPTRLLNLSSYIGGKNGYIPESGETAVSLFNVGYKLFAVVVLGSSDRDQDILELMHEATGVAYISYEN